MGYDLDRFVTNVDDEFICSICTMVLENGVQLDKCEHMFCDQCIKDWISINSICPIDRKPVTLYQIKPIPRAFNNLLLNLDIKCTFEQYGCRTTTKIESMKTHLNYCLFNPEIDSTTSSFDSQRLEMQRFRIRIDYSFLDANKEKTCDKGCGFKIPSTEFKDHNCIKLMTKLFLEQQEETNKSKKELREQKEEILNIKYELREQKEELRKSKIELREQKLEIINCKNEIQEQYEELIKTKNEIRLLVRNQKWQYGKKTMNEQNVIFYPKSINVSSQYRDLQVYNSRCLYPLTEINNYFLVKLLDLGRNHNITVGLTCKNYPSNTHLGLENGSIAYHANDRKIHFKLNSTTKMIPDQLGPEWKNNDVIECGLEFREEDDVQERSIFAYFKFNNIFIGRVAVSIPDGGFFPTVGLQSIDARVVVN